MGGNAQHSSAVLAESVLTSKMKCRGCLSCSVSPCFVLFCFANQKHNGKKWAEIHQVTAIGTFVPREREGKSLSAHRAGYVSDPSSEWCLQLPLRMDLSGRELERGLWSL